MILVGRSVVYRVVFSFKKNRDFSFIKDSKQKTYFYVVLISSELLPTLI